MFGQAVSLPQHLYGSHRGGARYSPIADHAIDAPRGSGSILDNTDITPKVLGA
jgi:hypothetical protein